MSQQLTARQAAVAALRDRSGNVSAHLERLLAQGQLPPEQRGLARELVMGVERRKGMLGAVMRAFLRTPGRKLPGAIEEILLVALYQLIVLDRVPDYAAVSEAVEQARSSGQPQQAGLVNAVLRGVLRAMGEVQQGPPPRRPDAIVLSPTSWRPLDRNVFPDPAVDWPRWLASACSLSRVLAQRWVGNFGIDRAVELALHASSRPPLICRVDTARTSVQAVLAELEAAGVPARPHVNGVSIVLDEHVNVTTLGPFAAGLIQPQDPTATAAVMAAGPQPGQSVMDFCAAPGTKTTHLAQLMAGRGSILAVDVSNEKLDRVRQSAGRLGIGIVQTRLASDIGSLAPESFDLVLADVPCSNTGVLARRPEARWRFTPQRLEKIVTDQQFLLRTASMFVRPGGRFVYSTCSIEPEETGLMARWADGHSRRLRLVEDCLTLPAGADDPTQWHDGGYWAAFEVK